MLQENETGMKVVVVVFVVVHEILVSLHKAQKSSLGTQIDQPDE